MEYINWAGHHNLGDDAMDKILRNYFKDTKSDWILFGGGTLISPYSEFFRMLKYPERTIGVSIGVSSNWDGQGQEGLSRIRRIYARDYYTYFRLKKYHIESTLSVDLLCHLTPSFSFTGERQGKYANLLKTDNDVFTSTRMVTESIMEIMPSDVKYIALSPEEDMVVHDAELFTDVQELLNRFARAEEVWATRLHANVLAWMAKVPKLHPVFYDKKVADFYNRVAALTPESAKGIIDAHLAEIKQTISTPP